jgi:hypothetical protein
LDVRFEAGTPVIDATISGPWQQAVEVTLTRPRPSSAAQNAGQYTFVLPANPAWKLQRELIVDDGGNSPYVNPFPSSQGNGFGSLRVLESGAATTIGKMPDGAPFASSHLMDGNGQLQAFTPLYKRSWENGFVPQGWLRGIIVFRDRAGVSDADGSMLWVHPNGYLEANGVLQQADVAFAASRYSPPASLQDALGDTVRWIGRDGGLVSNFNVLAHPSINSVTGALGLRANGSFTPGSGIISGHLSPPENSHWRPFGGVLFQKRRVLLGQFGSFGPRGTGAFSLAPQ